MAIQTSSRKYSQCQCDTALQADIYSWLMEQQTGEKEIHVDYAILQKKAKPDVQFISTTRSEKHWSMIFF